MKFEDKSRPTEDNATPPNVTCDLPDGWSWWSRRILSDGSYVYLFGTNRRFCYKGELHCDDNTGRWKFYIYEEKGIRPDGDTIVPDIPSVVESEDSREATEELLAVKAATLHTPD